MSYLSKSLRITDSGRETLSRAVAIDHDWALPASSGDILIEALDGMSTADLEAARMLAYHLGDVVAALLIRRDMAEREARGEA